MFININKNSLHSRYDSTFVVKRFRQLLWAIFLIATSNLINIFFSEREQKYFTVTILVSMIGVVLFSLYLERKGRESIARAFCLWTITIAVVYMAWINGGLRDPAMIAAPIVIIYSLLISSFRVFILILIFMIISIIIMGASTINGWTPYFLQPLGWDHIFGGVTISLLSAYIAWTVNQDMKKTLEDLSNENEKVIQSRETIQSMVEQDPFTGLFNRTACETHFQSTMSKMNDNNERIILFFIDLDNFKNINDSFGHNSGDDILIRISNDLKKSLLPSDVACRIGGDEFVLMIKRNVVFDIDSFANNILKVITTPYLISDARIQMTGSVGIAISPNDGNEFDDLRKKADIAMYKSKQLGKNTFSYYSLHLHEETLRKTSILNGLKNALANDLLDLHIQPKINLLTGKMESAEALIRWNRDNPNGFAPDEFIPVIESTELIHEIGKWSIEKSCLICKGWHDVGFNDLSISVNVSSVQFMRGNFKNLVFDALNNSGLEPQFLEIELTEHVLIQHNEIIKGQLKALKEHGIKLSIDDFGTGYSNLSYLINFKVDTIKLDKTFISELNTSTNHLAVVKAVIQMAQILDLQVVAEGVESDAIKDILVDLGCDFAQGFLWSKALPNKQFMNMIGSFNENTLCLH